MLAHHDAALEDAFRVVVENAPVGFPAGAVRRGMVDEGDIVELLAAASEIGTVETGRRAAFLEFDGNLAARHGGPGRQHETFEVGAGGNFNLGRGDVNRIPGVILQPVVMEPGSGSKHDLLDKIGEIVAFAAVAFDKGERRIAAQNDQSARMPCRATVAGRSGKHDFKGLVDNDSIAHPQCQPVGKPGRVEGHEMFALESGDAAEVPADEFMRFPEGAREGKKLDTGRQIPRRGAFLIPAAVDEDHAAGAGLRNRDGAGGLGCRAIGRVGECSEISILPVLDPPRGKPEAREPSGSVRTQGIDPRPAGTGPGRCCATVKQAA